MTPKEKLADALLKLFISSVRAGTSCEDVNDLSYHFKQSGYTGIFTGLNHFYDDHYELLETIEDLWNEKVP